MSLKPRPTSKKYKVKVGITIGDPSGIGPAITLKAIRRLENFADFVVIGDTWVFGQLPVPGCRLPAVKFIDLNNVSRKDFKFGQVRAGYGRASIEYLDKALELIKNKQIDCLVTCPISKESINKAGFFYGGHTEYFAKKTGVKDFVMLLLNNRLKISLVTRHLAIRNVPSSLTREELRRNIILTHKSLKDIFGIKEPRLAVCGLNPHASDNGLLGIEENKIIKPVLKTVRKKIGNIDGPLPADTAMFKSAAGQYDAIVAMYHDQALIALKLTGVGVNMTLGLPFIRTSPLHGTAFDIAGSPGAADPDSLVEAIKLAVRCSINLKKA